jgi:hypothetical protein
VQSTFLLKRLARHNLPFIYSLFKPSLFFGLFFKLICGLPC